MDTAAPAPCAIPSDVSGGCLCGRTRYTANTSGALTCVCHCRACQRQTGSAFSVLLGVATAAFTLHGDALSQVSTLGDSGVKVQRWFCGHCGSPIYSTAQAAPLFAWIKAGTLDNNAWLRPTLHMWSSEKQPWIPQTDDAAWIPGNPAPVH